MRRIAAIALPAILLSVACSAQPAVKGGAVAESAGGKPFRMEAVGNFDEPFAMAFLPDGRLLVTEKKGRLKLRAGDGRVVDVAGVLPVAAGGQGGLLDVAVSPDFAASGLIYWSFSEPQPGGSALALARGRLVGSGGPARLTGVEVLWRAGSAGPGGHFGANLAFAPDGGSLFLSAGERQRFTPAQDPNQALGKVHHLTLDGAPAPGNPGAGQTGAATVQVADPPANSVEAARTSGRRVAARSPNTTPAETWTRGHRNPLGIAFDEGGRLWEMEMGPKGGDEVNLLLPGRNYGWPRASNGENYDGVPIPDHRAEDGFEPPKVWWNPSISPGGMMIYKGTLFPQWRGSMLIAALGGEALIRVALDGTDAAKADEWPMGTRLRDVAEAADGAVWVLEDGGKGAGGRLLRLTPSI